VTWRSAHGAARRGGQLVVVETCPPDELPPASPSNTVRSDRDQHGRFIGGNAAARLKRLRPGLRGVIGALQPDPIFRAFVAWGRRYACARRSELAQMHGGTLSTGVGTLVESAGLALAASRYISARGGETGDVQMLAQAARLSEQAKQLELSAWELAAREAKARPSSNPWQWLTAPDDGDPDADPGDEQDTASPERAATPKDGTP
jgi:hypothetical protein